MSSVKAIPREYVLSRSYKPRPGFRCPTCRKAGTRIDVYAHIDNDASGADRRYLTRCHPCGCAAEATAMDKVR